MPRDFTPPPPHLALIERLYVDAEEIEACGAGNEAATMRQAAATIAQLISEKREIMNLLGYDENGHGLIDQRPFSEADPTIVNICHDPYYDLEGAIVDLERTGVDKVCILTIRRVQARLADVSNYAAGGFVSPPRQIEEPQRGDTAVPLAEQQPDTK